MNKESIPSLVDVVERGDLRKKTENGTIKPIEGTSFDLAFLKIANAAVREKFPTAIVLPVSASNTSILLSAVILTDNCIRAGSNDSKASITAQVALATKQLRLRSFYDDIFIKKERLSNYFPRTIVSEDKVSKVGDRPKEFYGRTGRLHFLSDLSRLDKIDPEKLNGIVLESAAASSQWMDGTLKKFGNKIPVIYITMNPMDQLIDKFLETGVVWAWDEAELRYLLEESEESSSALCTGVGRLRGACRTSYELQGPGEESKIDKKIGTLWYDLEEIQHHPGGLTFDALRWVWGVFNTYSQLLVPATYYDQKAREAWINTPILEEAGQQASSYSENAVKKEDREYWSILADDLREVYEIANSVHPKVLQLIEKTKEVFEKGSSLLLLVKNKASKQAVREFLEESSKIPFNWDQEVDISTYKEYRKGRIEKKYLEIAIAGPVSRRFSSLFTLPTSSVLTVFTHGPWERTRTANQIQRVLNRLKDLSRGESKENAIRKLGIDLDFVYTHEKRKEQERDISFHKIEDKESVEGSVIEGSVVTWDPFDVEVVGDIDSYQGEVNAPAKSSQEGIKGKVDALKIDLNERKIFFEPNQKVTKIIRSGEKKVAAKSLKAGDKILLINRQARKDLFDVVAEKLDEMPEFKERMFLIREWKERVKRGAHKFDLNFQKILNKMSGTELTSPQTLRGWVLGYSNGPQNPKDIKRYGEAVGGNFLIQHWAKIAKALRRMRQHHRKIGRMLSKKLWNMDTDEANEEEYFDRRLGILYSDLLEAISVFKVESVSQSLFSVPYQCANRLLEPGEISLLESDIDE